jgi:hypothetical protein
MASQVAAAARDAGSRKDAARRSSGRSGTAGRAPAERTSAARADEQHGLRLDGTYVADAPTWSLCVQSADASAKLSLPDVVSFWKDGRFVHGRARCEHLIDSAADASSADPPAQSTQSRVCSWGTYGIANGSLELQYANGRVEHVEFSMPLFSATHPAHPTVYLNGERYRRQQ